MTDPIDFGAPEIFFDGVSGIKIIEGVVRMTLYAHHNGESRAIAKLAIPISELPEVIQQLVISLTEAAKTIVKSPLGH